MFRLSMYLISCPCQWSTDEPLNIFAHTKGRVPEAMTLQLHWASSPSAATDNGQWQISRRTQYLLYQPITPASMLTLKSPSRLWSLTIPVSARSYQLLSVSNVSQVCTLDKEVSFHLWSYPSFTYFLHSGQIPLGEGAGFVTHARYL